MSVAAWEFIDDLENSNQDLLQVQFLNQPFLSAVLLDLQKGSIKDTKQLNLIWALGKYRHILTSDVKGVIVYNTLRLLKPKEL